MKKLCCMFLVLLTLFSTGIVSYAATPNQDLAIIVEHEDEILEFLNSDQYDANYNYSFIIEGKKGFKAVCYMCGRPNMGTKKRSKLALIYTDALIMNYHQMCLANMQFMKWNDAQLVVLKISFNRWIQNTL